MGFLIRRKIDNYMCDDSLFEKRALDSMELSEILTNVLF